MLDRDAVEKALLIGIVREKNWQILILENITKEFFTIANHKLYDYIKGYVDTDKYPDLPVLSYEFDIDDESIMSYNEAGELSSLCEALRNAYIKEQTEYQIKQLNSHNKEIIHEPLKFIDRLGQTYNELKLLGFQNRSVSLFEGIDDILSIDPNDVISTGFEELDEALVGWKRGEELAVFMARTNQGKSWFGLKFALAAALKGERVGIYSGEMSKRQLQERIICCGKQSYTTSKEESLKFLQSKNIDIKLLTQKELRRRANVTDIEEFIIRDKLTMIIIDQLSLMEDNNTAKNLPLRQQYGNISNDLLTLSSRYSLPCILLVQSNRQGSLEQRGPTIENIAESDAVGQNATRVISMRNENGLVTLNVVKNRYGPVGFTQKYEVDFSINKYKPIKEAQIENTIARKAKARQMFGGSAF